MIGQVDGCRRQGRLRLRWMDSDSLTALVIFFFNQIIGHPLWPAYPPYLVLYDCYLWESLKDSVYKNNSHTEYSLKKLTGVQYQ